MTYEEIVEFVTLVLIVLIGYVIGLITTLFIQKVLKDKRWKEMERDRDRKEIEEYKKALDNIMIKLSEIETRLKDNVTPDQNINHITYHNTNRKEKHNDVELQILSLLENGEKSSREIEVSIGKTREHTARLMKKLFEEGYVRRDEKKKPYIYTLTEEGRKIIKRDAV
ncbi:MAG: hypothetical protein QW416_02020 [Candidatus Nitrosocaldaceae archaeon]